LPRCTECRFFRQAKPERSVTALMKSLCDDSDPVLEALNVIRAREQCLNRTELAEVAEIEATAAVILLQNGLDFRWTELPGNPSRQKWFAISSQLPVTFERQPSTVSYCAVAHPYVWFVPTVKNWGAQCSDFKRVGMAVKCDTCMLYRPAVRLTGSDGASEMIAVYESGGFLSSGPRPIPSCWQKGVLMLPQLANRFQDCPNRQLAMLDSSTHSEKNAVVGSFPEFSDPLALEEWEVFTHGLTRALLDRFSTHEEVEGAKQLLKAGGSWADIAVFIIEGKPLRSRGRFVAEAYVTLHGKPVLRSLWLAIRKMLPEEASPEDRQYMCLHIFTSDSEFQKSVEGLGNKALFRYFLHNAAVKDYSSDDFYEDLFNRMDIWAQDGNDSTALLAFKLLLGKFKVGRGVPYADHVAPQALATLLYLGLFERDATPIESTRCNVRLRHFHSATLDRRVFGLFRHLFGRGDWVQTFISELINSEEFQNSVMPRWRSQLASSLIQSAESSE